MLVRYSVSLDGPRVVEEKARIYTYLEHGISRSAIPAEVSSIINALRNNGYVAYIVGGAIRDLLLKKKPKDFDVVTNAHPQEIRDIFRQQAILIGRRFKLVHVRTKGRNYVEVITFRSTKSDNNSYGSLEEDYKRRDFSCNALYYCPKEEYLIDYVDGLNDIRNKQLKTVLPLETIFKEDPIRILRALKYAIKAQLVLSPKILQTLQEDTIYLRQSQTARVTDEIFKILESGYSVALMKGLYENNVLRVLLPGLHAKMKKKENIEKFYGSLAAMDKRLQKESSIPPKRYHLLLPFVRILKKNKPEKILSELKEILQPLNISAEICQKAYEMHYGSPASGVSPTSKVPSKLSQNSNES